MKRVVVLDPSLAGISGDMFLSALVSLGASVNRLYVLEDVLTNHVEGVERLELDFVDVVKRGIRAKRLKLKVSEKHRHKVGREIIETAEKICSAIDLDEKAKSFVLKAIETLVEAETFVHGEKNSSNVHLHELSSIDTFVDIVGSAIALQSLDLLKADFVSLPVAVGGGKIYCTHGLYPAPAPATLEILKRVKAKIVGGPVEHELTTPTGAAIVASTVREFIDFLPNIRIESIGYGAGSKDLENIPNVLRIVVGSSDMDPGGLSLAFEDIAVVETDIDDVTGEVVGYVFNKLIEVGAKDVAIVPLYMKKNRPGYMIRVLADLDNITEVVKILVAELGTLGVRYTRWRRATVPIREKKIIDIEVDGTRYPVELKISKDMKNNILVIKPEYESLKAIAEATGLPLRIVRELVDKETKPIDKV